MKPHNDDEVFEFQNYKEFNCYCFGFFKGLGDFVGYLLQYCNTQKVVILKPGAVMTYGKQMIEFYIIKFRKNAEVYELGRKVLNKGDYYDGFMHVVDMKQQMFGTYQAAENPNVYGNEHETYIAIQAMANAVSLFENYVKYYCIENKCFGILPKHLEDHSNLFKDNAMDGIVNRYNILKYLKAGENLSDADARLFDKYCSDSIENTITQTREKLEQMYDKCVQQMQG